MLSYLTRAEMMSQASKAMKAWEEGDRKQYASILAPTATMNIPKYGIDVTGIDAIWDVRQSMKPDDQPLDVHLLTNLTVNLSSLMLYGVATVISRTTGAITVLANVTFKFNSKGLVVSYYQDVTFMASQPSSDAFITTTTITKEPLTIGYHKIRGLAAPLRAMCHYKGQPYINKAYGEDAGQRWFAEDKPELAKANGLINLPFVIDGETVVTQSNSCMLYLGQRLGIDAPQHFMRNHQALDQIADLRNDTMKIVYPFAGVAKADFAAALAKHLGGAARTHLAKLEAFCAGPFLCGDEPQSADFHLLEMLDTHLMMASQTDGVGAAAFDLAGSFPKLAALHGRFKAAPTLQSYFASEAHGAYAVNSPAFTHFVGAGYDGVQGATTAELIDPTAPPPPTATPPPPRTFVLGASGMVGARLVDEAKRRGHAVIAASRTGDVRVDAADADALAAALATAKADTLLVALGPSRVDAAAPPLVETYKAIVAACRKAGGVRALFVGGAGSLYQSEGGGLQIEHPMFPKEYRNEAQQHIDALHYLHSVSDDIAWTSLTPPPMIAPGERTGDFRLGGNAIVGFSISAEDFAVAAIDEVEQPKHQRRRFAVAAADAAPGA